MSALLPRTGWPERTVNFIKKTENYQFPAILVNVKVVGILVD